jgi:hypothetical protein
MDVGRPGWFTNSAARCRVSSTSVPAPVPPWLRRARFVVPARAIVKLPVQFSFVALSFVRNCSQSSIVVRAKLFAVDIESVTRVLDTVKRCVCLCPSPPGRNLALLSASLLAESFPCPRHKIRSTTVSSNYEASSPCALASAAADSAIKITSAPCSARFAVGNFSTLQIHAACPVCARSSSIGFRACSRLPSSRRTRHPLLDHTSPARSRHDLVVVPCVVKKFQASGEDEASRVVFTKCTTKSSNILRDSSSIRQNYLVEEKIFIN